MLRLDSISNKFSKLNTEVCLISVLVKFKHIELKTYL